MFVSFGARVRDDKWVLWMQNSDMNDNGGTYVTWLISLDLSDDHDRAFTSYQVTYKYIILSTAAEQKTPPRQQHIANALLRRWPATQ
jgi:hypothetical protein